ncbi:MAG: M13 family metallopeptidase, partial [Verrucomicrobiota bacterium]|nr:M13 family metallopeptidase [Verrucomicrobiota bacterium]
MTKLPTLLLLPLLAAGTALAQSEPQKNAQPIGSATLPPQVHKPSKPPTGDEIPPPATIPETQTADKDATASGTPSKNAPAFDLQNMDQSVKPSEDFYTFANGTWLKNNPIPPEESRWGSFNELIEKNNAALKIAAEKAAAGQAGDAPEIKKVGDYYASGMDEKAIDEAGAKPLADEFKKIDAIKSKEDLLQAIAHLHSIGVGAFFGFTSGQDDKNSKMVIAQAYQGGLGMPDRDYYTKEDDASKKLRDQYVAHVTKMLTLAGTPEAKAGEEAKRIMALETSLAKPARTRVELRDPQKNYNKMDVAGLQKLTPAFNWKSYFKAIDEPTPGDINVGQPDFFKAANDVFAKTSLDDWKTYLKWHLI